MMMAPYQPRESEEKTPVLVRWGAIITFSLALLIQGVFFTVWLTRMRTDVDKIIEVQKEVPVYSVQLKADIEYIRQRQMEVLAKLDEFDKGGTRALQIQEQRTNQMAIDVASLNSRCADTGVRIDRLGATVLENKIRIEDIIRAIAPHAVGPTTPRK